MLRLKRASRHRTEKKKLTSSGPLSTTSSQTSGNRRPPAQALLPRPCTRQPPLRRLLCRSSRLPERHRLGSSLQRGLCRREGERGGAPSAFDRILSSRLGVAAVEGLMDGRKNVMAGIVNNEVVFTPFKETITLRKPIHPDLIRLVDILSV